MGNIYQDKNFNGRTLSNFIIDSETINNNDLVTGGIVQDIVNDKMGTSNILYEEGTHKLIGVKIYPTNNGRNILPIDTKIVRNIIVYVIVESVYNSRKKGDIPNVVLNVSSGTVTKITDKVLDLNIDFTTYHVFRIDYNTTLTNLIDISISETFGSAKVVSETTPEDFQIEKRITTDIKNNVANCVTELYTPLILNASTDAEFIVPSNFNANVVNYFTTTANQINKFWALIPDNRGCWLSELIDHTGCPVFNNVERIYIEDYNNVNGSNFTQPIIIDGVTYNKVLIDLGYITKSKTYFLTSI